MKRQRGASGFTMLAMVFLSIAGLVLLLKLLPLYSQDMAVTTVFENIQEESKTNEFSAFQLEEMLMRRFRTNDTSELMEFVIISGKGSDLTIEMVYERRVSLFSNIELVATFEHYVELSE